MLNTIALKVNNHGIMNIMQDNFNEDIYIKRLDKTMKYQKIIDIPAGDMVMLVNFYKYIKENDIKNDFINPHGKNADF